MASRLREYLQKAYESRRERVMRRNGHELPIQIDDQDDNDNINEFCTVFVQVGRKDELEVELEGALPVTREMADLAEIYHGKANADRGQVVLHLSTAQIDALQDLAALVKKTAGNGTVRTNPDWFKVAARTASSLQRFVRLIHEYEAAGTGRA